MTKKINEVDIKNVMENFAQKSQEDQEALREKANKLINSKNNQLSAQDKLSNLIEKVNQDFPGTLPEDAKASNDVSENLKILQKIEAKVIEVVNNPNNKVANQHITNILQIAVDKDNIVQEYKQDAQKKLAELITTVKKNFPDMLPEEAKVSDNISENLKISKIINDESIKNLPNVLNSKQPIADDNLMDVRINSTNIKNTYQLLKEIEEKDQSVKKAKSMGQRIKAAPSKLINKARKKVNNILGR